MILVERFYACTTCRTIGSYNLVAGGYSDMPPQELVHHFHRGRPGIRLGFKSELAARQWLEAHPRQNASEVDGNAS
ncbi:MAG: hypothetical protein IT320_21475 [Anaerolineae bacterium]|nr:hypothetical protein [Anaerolineae bacterium]